MKINKLTFQLTPSHKAKLNYDVIAIAFSALLFCYLNLGNSYSAKASGLNYTSATSGSWATPSIWLGGSTPPSPLNGDNITISNNHTVQKNSDLTGQNNITITIDINAILTIVGNLIIQDNFVLNNYGTLIVTGYIQINNGAAITINGEGDVDVNGNLSFGNNADLTVNGNLTVGGDMSFGTLNVFDGTGQVYLNGEGCSSWSGSGSCGSIILPIELLSFSATDNNDGTIKLLWSTASEQNNDYFTIQRSYDGIHYNGMTEVKGNGTSKSIIQYSYYDTNPGNTRLYYRLTQTDFDGTCEYFSPIMLQLNLPPSESIIAYPNPLGGTRLMINIPFPQVGNIKVLDHSGSIVLEKKINESDGVIELEFNRDLFPRVYLISYEANSFVRTTRFVKK
jgi:hypothetical protein